MICTTTAGLGQGARSTGRVFRKAGACSSSLRFLESRTKTTALVLRHPGSLALMGVRPLPLSLLRVRDQVLQIQQVLRFEGLFRPFERGVELHPDKIPDFPVDAIPYVALERLFGFIPADFHTQRNGLFHLQAGPRSANVLQDGCGPLLAARTVFPANLYHVRAHHTNFQSPRSEE